MCKERLKFEDYENVWVAGKDEATDLFSERASLKCGDKITLTDGSEVVVIDNFPSKNFIVAKSFTFCENIMVGTATIVVHYPIIKSSTYGHSMEYEDFVRLTGVQTCREMIRRKEWGYAADILDKLRYISVDISEFAPYFSDIYRESRFGEQVFCYNPTSERDN